MSCTTSSSSSYSEPPTPAANVSFYPYRLSGNMGLSCRAPLRVLGTTIMCSFLKAACGEKSTLSRPEQIKMSMAFFTSCIDNNEKDALVWKQLFLFGKKILNDTEPITEREVLDISAYLLTPLTSKNRLRVDILSAYKTLITFLVCAEKKQQRENATELLSSSSPAVSSTDSSTSPTNVMSSLTRILMRVRQSLDSAMQHPRSRPLHIHSSISCPLCSTYPQKKKTPVPE
jgi:hypothetical protein